MGTNPFDEGIRRTLEAYASPDPMSEDQIVMSLAASGLSRTSAEKLVALVPLACGRVLLSHMADLEFVKEAELEGSDGTCRTLDLRTEPIFTRALEIATDMYHSGPRGLFAPCATASAEVHCVNKLLTSGGTLRGVKFTAPKFMRLTFEEWQA